MPFYLSRTWRCIPVLLSSALLVSACETTPREGDTAGPEISIFEAGYTPALSSTSNGFRSRPRVCRDVMRGQQAGWALLPYHLLPAPPPASYELTVLATDLSGIESIEVVIPGALHNARAVMPANAVVEVRDLEDGGRPRPHTFVRADFSAESPRTARELRFSLGGPADLQRRFAEEHLVLKASARDFASNERAWPLRIGTQLTICTDQSL
jgi:hypothetical protein